jgi:hypothetical protein
MESAMQELEALLEYLVKHNADHAREIMDLAARAKELGRVKAYDDMVKGVGLLEDSNKSLEAALTALRG